MGLMPLVNVSIGSLTVNLLCFISFVLLLLLPRGYTVEKILNHGFEL